MKKQDAEMYRFLPKQVVDYLHNIPKQCPYTKSINFMDILAVYI